MTVPGSSGASITQVRVSTGSPPVEPVRGPDRCGADRSGGRLAALARVGLAADPSGGRSVADVAPWRVADVGPLSTVPSAPGRVGLRSRVRSSPAGGGRNCVACAGGGRVVRGRAMSCKRSLRPRYRSKWIWSRE